MFKHPFLVESKAYEHIDYICNDVCEVGRFHESGNEFGEACAPSGIFENVDTSFEDE